MERTYTRRQKVRALDRAVRREYPDVYVCPGLGYCGPDWEKADAMFRRGETAIELEEAGMDPDNASAHLRRCEWADAQGFTEDDAD
jgi:hypothetical protein